MSSGTLHIVSTPIGNLQDITIRAIKTLLKADYIACEDTRKTGLLFDVIRTEYAKLFHDLINTDDFKNRSKKPIFIRYDDRMEFQQTVKIIGYLENSQSVTLVSDAGTPLISDPGFILVRECLKRNIKIEVVPGPSAVISALIKSGLPTNQFLFMGYPPEKQSQRRKLFNDLKNLKNSKSLLNPTVIFYLSPHKVLKTLADLLDVLGDIEITIVRELTKIHEEVIKYKISRVLTASNNLKGELVLVF